MLPARRSKVDLRPQQWTLGHSTTITWGFMDGHKLDQFTHLSSPKVSLAVTGLTGSKEAPEALDRCGVPRKGGMRCKGAIPIPIPGKPCVAVRGHRQGARETDARQWPTKDHRHFSADKIAEARYPVTEECALFGSGMHRGGRHAEPHNQPLLYVALRTAGKCWTPTPPHAPVGHGYVAWRPPTAGMTDERRDRQIPGPISA